MILTMLFLLGSALATGDGTSEAPVPVEAAATASDADLDRATAEDLLVVAVQRMGQGDHEGADLLLEQALEREPETAVEVAYQRANNLALQRRYEDAATLYASIVRDHPASHRSVDARFRAAEMRAVNGDPAGALSELEALPPTRQLADEAAAKIRLNRALWHVQADLARKPERAVAKALKKTPPGQVPYYEAKAWAALAAVRLEAGAQTPLEGSDRALRKAVLWRKAAFVGAEAAIKQAIALKEPEWILEGLLLLAPAYENFADALLAAPEPEDLSDPQLQIYRQEMSQQAEQLLVRAVAYLDQGRQLATRLTWNSQRVQDIEVEYERLFERVSEGPP